MIRTALRALAVAAPVLLFGSTAPGCFSDDSAAPDAGIDVSTPAAALLTASPLSLDFGTVQVGAQSAPLILNASNIGSASTGALAMQIAGADVDAFVLDSDGCSGQIVAGGGSCAVKMHFAPKTAGTKGASITLAGVPGGSVSVPLAGMGADAGALGFTPPSYDFGAVAPGGTAPPVTFSLKNGGKGPSPVVSLSVTGTNHGEFTLMRDLCTGKPLAAGAMCPVDVTFAPSSVGAKAATLTATAGQTTATASLAGTGAMGAAFVVTPAPHDFGSVTQGTTTPPQTFTLQNTGGVDSGVPSIAFGGPNGADFAVVATSNQCTGALAAGATCTFGVAFTPSAASVESGTLTVSAPSTTTGTAALSGTGLAPAAIAIAPPTYDFGPVAGGTASASNTFTVTNNGGVATGALTAQLGGTGTPQFVIDANGCGGMALAPAAKCTVSAHFLPGATSVGGVQASLSVGGTPGGTTVATITGTALAPAALAISPMGQPFGTISSGSSSSDVPFAVTNNGAVPSGAVAVSISGANSGQFALGTQNCSGVALQPKGTCTVNVHFSPTMLGPLAARLDATAAPGGTASAMLTGTGATAAQLTISPPAAFAGFGTVGYPATSGPYAFTVTNNGGVTTGALAVQLGGAALSQYSLMTATAQPCPGATLAPGASCTVGVTFAPTSGTAGVQQASLNVSATPGGSPSAVLTGTAVTAVLKIAAPNGFTDFGKAAPGFPSGPYTFTISNTGGAASGTPLAVSIAQPAPNQYSLNAATAQPCPTSLAAGASCTVDVTFAPTVTTGTPAATLNATATPGGSPSLGLSGTAVLPPKLVIQPPTKFPGNFGSINVGTSVSYTFTLANTGGLPSDVPTITTDNADFTIPPAANMCKGAVAGGGNCPFDVQFKPSSMGTESVTVTANATRGGPATYGPVQGTGLQAVLTIKPPNWAQGTNVQSPIRQLFTVTNGGNVGTTNIPTPSLNDPSGLYSIQNNGCQTPLGSGQPCTFLVEYSGGTTPNEAKATLLVTDTASDQVTAPLDCGAGVAIVPNPANLGTVAAGKTGAPVQLTITNFTSATTGTITGVGVGGNYPATDFPISGDSCLNRALAPYGQPGNSCTLNVAFAPTAGAKTGTTEQDQLSAFCPGITFVCFVATGVVQGVVQ
jgi:hypothetical protein